MGLRPAFPRSPMRRLVAPLFVLVAIGIAIAWFFGHGSNRPPDTVRVDTGPVANEPDVPAPLGGTGTSGPVRIPVRKPTPPRDKPVTAARNGVGDVRVRFAGTDRPPEAGRVRVDLVAIAPTPDSARLATAQEDGSWLFERVP